MLLIGTSRAFGRNLLRGIARYARIYGPWEIYRLPPAYRDEDGKATALSMIHEWKADGLIIRETQDFAHKIPKDIPTVISSESESPVPSCGNIIGDHEEIGKLAARHLLDLGLKNFAFCGYNDISWSPRRCAGFKQVIEEAGFSVDVYKQPQMPSEVLWEKEQPYLESWIRTLKTPVGIMACSDERSEQVLAACKAVDLNIPEDVALIGADDDEMICDMCYPTLSSVAFNAERAGFRAAQLLEKMIKSNVSGDMLPVVFNPTHVVARHSTDMLAVGDKVVANSLRFIRDNSHEPIFVDDVAQEAAVSRRMLERKFKKFLGSSVYKHILKVRTERVAQMLIDTDLTVSQISSHLKFTNHQQVARYFKQFKGVSPVAFRKSVRNISE